MARVASGASTTPVAASRKLAGNDRPTAQPHDGRLTR